MFKSLPYAQALRLKRISTDDQDLQQSLINLRGQLTNRNYPKAMVDKGFNKLKRTLPPRPPRKEVLTMIIEYHPTNPAFASMMHKVWSKHKDNLPPSFQRPIIAYTRPNNLRQLLTKARYSDNGNMELKPYSPKALEHI
jgi:hypothetical protein